MMNYMNYILVSLALTAIGQMIQIVTESKKMGFTWMAISFATKKALGLQGGVAGLAISFAVGQLVKAAVRKLYA